jgi:hypothetical protein
MRKKRIRAERKRTPPAMPTPRPTFRPVLEELEGEEVAPVSRGEPEFEDEVDALDEVALVAEVGVELDAVVAAVLLVDDRGDVLGVVEVDPTNSTVVGTDAMAWAVVVGV